jgi:hypothetical protein
MTDDARSPAPHRWARALFALAGLTAVAAVVGFVATTGGEANGTEPVTTFVATADTAPATTPSTSTPTASPPAGPPDTTIDDTASGDTASGDTASGDTASGDTTHDNTMVTASPPTATPTPTSAPLSPLADLLGEPGSAILEQIEPRVAPVHLRIDDLYIDVPIRPVGLEDDGQLEIPDETEVGWYRYGAVPDRPGATVLAGHVTWNRTNGPFWLLRDLEQGAHIDVELADGSVRTYEAIERAVYGKDELPRDRIWRNTGDETLVLITCGGAYNPDIRRYLENVVVYATPAEMDESSGGDQEDGG